MTVAAFGLPDVDRLEIHCDPANVASAAIPAKLGYRHRETLRANKLTPRGDPRDTMVFELPSEDYRADSPTSEPEGNH